jgi:hypothetical protein
MAYAATLLVGAVFVFSGALKAVDARTFIRDLSRYRLISPALVPLVALIATGLELAMGVALMLHVYPAVVVPAAILVLLLLAALTLWGERSRDMEDCGCYGGVILLTPKQSVALDIGFIALLALALRFPAPDHRTQAWTLVATGLALVMGAVLSGRSREKPLVNLSRLQPGRRWKRQWLPQRDLNSGNQFVVFLSKNCPYCKRWVPLMNVMNTQADLPDVVGIMGISDEEMAAFREEHLIHFPVVQMRNMLFRQMVEGYPTAVLLEDGVVKETWEGEIPKPYFDRIKQFYDQIRPPKGSTKAAPFGG